MGSRMHISKLVILWMMSLVFSSTSHAETKSQACALMETAAEPQTWKDWGADIHMRVSSDGGKKKIIQIRMLSTPEGQRMRLDFKVPAKLRGMQFLAHSMKDRSDVWYMYVLMIKRVIKLPLSATNQMVRDMMGMGFFKPQPELFEFSCTDETMELLGDTCHRVLATPRDAAARIQYGYGRLAYWIEPKSGEIRRVDFFNKGELVRHQTYEELKQTEGGPIPVRITSFDLADKKTTSIELIDLEVNTDVDEGLFEKRSLGR